jgi:hypothetical protein
VVTLGPIGTGHTSLHKKGYLKAKEENDQNSNISPSKNIIFKKIPKP